MIIELESKCSFDAKLNKHFFVRAHCVRPVYLGCAARIMGEGNVMVWYGLLHIALLDLAILKLVECRKYVVELDWKLLKTLHSINPSSIFMLSFIF